MYTVGGFEVTSLTPTPVCAPSPQAVGTSGVGGVLGSHEAGDEAGDKESEWEGDGGSDSGDA